jgi:hypothetical protein
LYARLFFLWWCGKGVKNITHITKNSLTLTSEAISIKLGSTQTQVMALVLILNTSLYFHNPPPPLRSEAICQLFGQKHLSRM